LVTTAKLAPGGGLRPPRVEAAVAKVAALLLVVLARACAPAILAGATGSSPWTCCQFVGMFAPPPLGGERDHRGFVPASGSVRHGGRGGVEKEEKRRNFGIFFACDFEMN
tara:strand:+ start:1344 stop:1673 length:330 start_codon:yes stop_codon:yes gene_type:complete